MKILIVAAMSVTSGLACANGDLQQRLLGSWCLNTTEFEGEHVIDGSIWAFAENGRFVREQAYVLEGGYHVEADTIYLDEYGALQVVEIADRTMKARHGGTYHFTKNRCLPAVARARRLVRLNNAIVLRNMNLVKSLVADGVDISGADPKNALGSTPLMVAINHGGEEFVGYILSLDPDLSVTDALGRSAMDLALKSENPAIVKLIENAHRNLVIVDAK